MIHRIVETQLEKTGEPRIKRGRGRPRKHVEEHQKMHNAFTPGMPETIKTEEKKPEVAQTN